MGTELMTLYINNMNMIRYMIEISFIIYLSSSFLTI